MRWALRVVTAIALTAFLLGSAIALSPAALGETTTTETHHSVLDHPAGADISASTIDTEPDLSMDLSLAQRQVQNDFEFTLFLERALGADTAAERDQIVDAYFERLHERVLELVESERTVLEAAAEAGGSSDQLINELAIVTGEARGLEANLDRLMQRDAEFPGVSLRPQVANVQNVLMMFTGPVRTEFFDAYHGHTFSHVKYVSSTQESVVLAAIRGDSYLRESIRLDNHHLESINLFDDIDEVAAVVLNQYPIASDGDITVLRQPVTDLWSVELVTTRGPITAFVDGYSKEVVREHQQHSLDHLNVSETEILEENGLSIELNRTYPDGPLKVSVVDAESDEPVSATVELYGTTFDTGVDGSVWVIEPSAPATLTIETADDRTVEIEL